MTTSHPSSRDISRKLVALFCGANFFGALIIFLYFLVIDPLPVGGVAVRSLETEDIVTFGIAGVVIFVGAFTIISRLGRPIRNWLCGIYDPQPPLGHSYWGNLSLMSRMLRGLYTLKAPFIAAVPKRLLRGCR